MEKDQSGEDKMARGRNGKIPIGRRALGCDMSRYNFSTERFNYDDV